jgi:hypothetical protein
MPIKPVLGSIFLLLLSVTAFAILYNFNWPAKPAAPPVNRYAGSIVLPAAGHGGCRHLKFDNVTGSIKDEGTSQCPDSTTAAAERLGQLSDSFQHK